MPTGAESTLSPSSEKLSSNFTGEVFAILSSLKEVLQMNIPPSHIVIYSDLQAAIRALTNPRPKSVIICQTQEIISELKKKNSIILLQWAPAHVGEDYNERADELAKQRRDKSSEISTAELDVCALVKKKVESSTPKKFDWQSVIKINTSREIYSTTVRLRSKQTLGVRFLQDGQKSLTPNAIVVRMEL